MDFAHNLGFMPGGKCKQQTEGFTINMKPMLGNDLHNAHLTITEAQEWCASHPQCLGFTFAGPPGDPPADALLDIYFKSSAEWSPGDGWHTYVVSAAPAAVNFSHNLGFMPGGKSLLWVPVV